MNGAGKIPEMNLKSIRYKFHLGTARSKKLEKREGISEQSLFSRDRTGIGFSQFFYYRTPEEEPVHFLSSPFSQSLCIPGFVDHGIDTPGNGFRVHIDFYTVYKLLDVL